MTIKEIKKKIPSDYFPEDDGYDGLHLSSETYLGCKEEFVCDLRGCKDLTTVFFNDAKFNPKHLIHNLNLLEKEFGIPQTKLYSWVQEVKLEDDYHDEYEDFYPAKQKYAALYFKTNFWFKNFITLDLFIILVRCFSNTSSYNSFDKIVNFINTNGNYGDYDYFHNKKDLFLSILASIKELSKISIDASANFIILNESVGLVSSLEYGPLSFLPDLHKANQQIKITQIKT